MKRAFMVYAAFVFLVTILYGVGHMQKLATENARLHEEEEILRVDIERQKAAMFKQGIWYYRTTVLGQCLLQE